MHQPCVYIEKLVDETYVEGAAQHANFEIAAIARANFKTCFFGRIPKGFFSKYAFRHEAEGQGCHRRKNTG